VRLPGDPPPDLGHRVVRELQEVEVIDHHDGVGQQSRRGDGVRVAGVRVDRDEAHRLPERVAATLEPADDAGAGPALDLAE